MSEKVSKGEVVNYYFYFPIVSIGMREFGERLEIDENSVPDIESDVSSGNDDYKIYLYSKSSVPCLLKIVWLDQLKSSSVDYVSIKSVYDIAEAAMTAIRMVWMQSAQFFGAMQIKRGLESDPDVHEFGASIQSSGKYDPQLVKGFMGIVSREPYLSRLYSDGINKTLSYSSRFVSLYMILESKYGPYNSTHASEVNTAAKVYESKIHKTILGTNYASKLFEMRNLCSHPYTKKRKSKEYSYNAINYDYRERIQILLPLVRRLAADILEEKLADGSRFVTKWEYPTLSLENNMREFQNDLSEL